MWSEAIIGYEKTEKHETRVTRKVSCGVLELYRRRLSDVSGVWFSEELYVLDIERSGRSIPHYGYSLWMKHTES